jgi:putative phosphoesterase
MKIGVLSDTHGDLSAWQAAWDRVLHDCDLVIHCGDILYHGPKFVPGPDYNPRELAAALNQLPIPILFVKGNADSEVDTLVIEAPIQSPYLLAQVEGTRILATHGHLQPLEDLLSLAAKWKVDWLLTGHLHMPGVQLADGVRHLNPGSTTYPLSPKPELCVPTCAYIEDDTATLIDLDSAESLNL